MAARTEKKQLGDDSSLSIHEEINNRLMQGRRECLHLTGMIRKLRSGQAMLLMKKDEAKKDLESYMNKMSDSFIVFRSDMHISIKSELNEKMQKIMVLREQCETRIEALTELCEEMEKLVQFGKNVTRPAEQRKAMKLQESFDKLMESPADIGEFDMLMKLEFYPAIPIDNIHPSMFGDLIIGTRVKMANPHFAQLKARSLCSKAENTSTKKDETGVVTHKEMVEVSTQTDPECNNIEKPAESDAGLKTNCTQPATDLQSHSHSSEQSIYSESFYNGNSHLSHIAPPPGLGYMSMPVQTYSSYTGLRSQSPPPGFGMYTSTGTLDPNLQFNLPQQTSLRLNPVLLTGLPLYNLNTTLCSNINYSVQNTPIYDCNSNAQKVFLQTDLFPVHHTAILPKSRSHAIPIVPPNLGHNTVTSQSNTGYLVQNKVSTVADKPAEAFNKSNTLNDGKTLQESIKREIITKKDAQGVDNKITETVKHSEKTVSDGNCTEKPVKTCNIPENPVFYIGNEFTEDSCGKSKAEIADNEKVGESSEMKRFEELLKRADELLETGKMDELRMERPDEASETVVVKVQNKSCNVDKNFKTNSKETDNTKMKVGKVFVKNEDDRTKNLAQTFGSVEKLSDCENKGDRKNVNTTVVNEETETMLSNIGVDLKRKLEEGKDVIVPLKPLRRPIRLPDKSQSHEKSSNSHKSTDSVSTSCNLQVDIKVESHLKYKETSLEQDQVVVNSVKPNLNAGRNLKDKITEINQNKSGTVELESVKTDTTSTCDYWDGPDVLDVSKSSDQTLRDAVRKNHGPSKSEVTQLNKDTLQSQTTWMKGYLQKNFSDKNLSDKEQESSKATTEKKEIHELATNLECKVRKSSTGNEDWDKMDTLEAVDKNNNQSTSSKKAKMVETWTAQEKHENDFKTFSESEAAEIPVRTANGSSTKVLEMKSEVAAIPGMKETPSKSNGKTNRKADAKNPFSIANDHLNADAMKGSKQRSGTRFDRLGALQSHWLRNPPGTNIKAKLLYKVSSGFHFPIGVTTNSMQQLIVTDTGNNCVKIFDQSGQFIRVFGCDLTPAMVRPSAVVLNEFDDIFVKDDCFIRVFDKSGNYILDLAKDLFTRPYGLVMTPYKQLLVLETDWRHPALVHISQDGKEVNKFAYQPLIPVPPGSKCRFMGISESNVVVSDLGLSRVYITTLEGLFLKQIGTFGMGPQQFFEPSGISVDIYGNMVIGDSKNNRVQVYRHDGTYVGLVEFDDKIIRPSGLHLTPESTLVVVNFLQHMIKVYQL